MKTTRSSHWKLFVAGLMCAGALQAQRPPLPGLPLVPPPVQHPALAGQPLIGQDAQTSAGTRAARVRPPAKRAPADPSTSGVKLQGKELRAAVKKVAALPWLKLEKAKDVSRRTGRPILLLQTLGDIDGFA